VAVRRVLLGVAWYLSIGVAVGIETGLHQATRFDPGFDPAFTAMVTVLVWPVVLWGDLTLFIAHLTGALPRP
jgi:hypothetical protein